jgi:peptidoglycan/LPS O-acetylase OafA/YrhL
MNYIKGYDGLRAIALIMVFYSHLSSFNFIHDLTERTRIEMICSGDTGVRLFFSLSGFLITLLLMREKLSAGKIDMKYFYLRRALKIIPPPLIYYFILILLMSLGYIGHQWIGLAISFFYLYDFVPSMYYTSELGSTWSLGVEEQFYLLWPLIISFFSNRIVKITIFILGVCWLAYLYLPIVVINFKSRPHLLNKYFFVRRWFLPACAPIITGALFSYLYVTNEEKCRRFFLKKASMFISACILFLLPLYCPKWLLSYVYPLQVIQGVGTSIMLIWIVFNQNSVFTKLLDCKPLSYIGKISYGLYIYHGIFIGTGPGSLYIQQYPLNIFLSFAIAVLSYEFYEKPILKNKELIFITLKNIKYRKE